MTDQNKDLSEAIVVHLTNYPGKNEAAFEARYGSTGIREQVRAMLDETISTRIDWAGMSLSEIGDELERVMRERHPELSDAAISKLGNYYTYQVK